MIIDSKHPSKAPIIFKIMSSISKCRPMKNWQNFMIKLMNEASRSKSLSSSFFVI